MDKRLLAYIAVAGATGAGLKSANAEVVYPPAHTRVGYETPLDLNHDGSNDFRLHSYELSGIGSVTVYPLHAENRIAATLQRCGDFPRTDAAAFQSGEAIGPQRKFLAKATCMVNESYSDGPWFMAQDHYLGLVFVIDGMEHYGWARLTNRGAFYGATDLTGYAYETVANTPIMAGDEGNSAGPSAPSGTLGDLALGATKFTPGGKS